MLELFDNDLIKKLRDYYIENGIIQSKKLVYSSVCKLFPEFKEVFEQHFDKTEFREIIYCILSNIDSIPNCKNPNCSNKVPLRNFVIGFQQCCCKNCISEYQKYSNEFKLSCSIGQKEHHKLNHTKTYIDNFNYEISGNYFIIKDYCKHGDVKIYKNTANKIYKNNESSFCLKCNEELFNSYQPSDLEIEEFQNKFSEFYKSYSHSMKYDWWIMYFPKQLKIIISYFEKYVEPFDKDKTDLLECYYQFLHNLKGRPRCLECDKEVTFCHSGNEYRKFCDVHLYGFNKSAIEYDLDDFIKTLGVNYLTNVNNIINGELDLYFPEQNFAIEFNGCWWHSDKFKDKNYHYNKWKECLDKNIQLMFIWEDDWLYKNDIIKSIIKSKLGIYANRVFARNCELKEVSASDAKLFLNSYHLQGYSIDKVRLGLYYNNELISIMTFGKSRFKQNDDFEIIRYCCKPDWQIVGGANKLYKNFKKLYGNNKQIISYADADISIGDLYKKLGMTEIGITENWKWLYNGKRYNRLNKIRFEQQDLFKCYSVGTLKYIDRNF